MTELSEAHVGSGRVMTVNGLIKSADLGVTLMHEHLQNDCSCWWNPPKKPERQHLAEGPVRIDILSELRQDPFVNKHNIALDELDLSAIDLLIVENVGNLVCPVNFALGTHKNVLVASVPEGDDKPYKYPGAYRGVEALVINKIDLLPYVNFDMEYFQRGAAALNPGLATFALSCSTGDGLDPWLEWVVEQVNTHGKGRGIKRI